VQKIADRFYRRPAPLTDQGNIRDIQATSSKARRGASEKNVNTMRFSFPCFFLAYHIDRDSCELILQLPTTRVRADRDGGLR